jgi:hypothetical protein
MSIPFCTMRDKYNGERSTIVEELPGWGEIHQHNNPKKNKKISVLYMSDKRAAEYEIFYNTQLHQWQRNGSVLPNGSYSFVITKNWKMLGFCDADEAIFNESVKTKTKIVFRHSTLTRGNDVLFAGTMNQSTWDERSGHYRPKAAHLAAYKLWETSHGVEGSTYLPYKKEKSDTKRPSLN